MTTQQRKIALLVLALAAVLLLIFMAQRAQAQNLPAEIQPYLPQYNPETPRADFESARRRLAFAEGGFDINPNDNGNWTGGKKGVGKLVGTNWGIAAPTYKLYFGKTPTEADMRALTYEEATEIYRALFWDKYGWGDLPYSAQPVAQLCFDGVVQAGSNGVKILQRALNAIGYSLVVDGGMGAMTKAALLEAAVTQPDRLYVLILQKRWDYYLSLSNFDAYGRGWANRIDCFRDYNNEPPGDGVCNIPSYANYT